MSDSIKLENIVRAFDSVSLTGICKNAGKTTVLNYLIKKLSSAYTLGITGIGRDGERVDAVTGTDKPEIYLPTGTIAATAADLLKKCSASREILHSTGIYSQLGEIIIFRAIDGGFAEIAGPSTTSGLVLVRDLFFSLGAQKVLLDGAVARKVFAGKSADAVILSAGASYSRDMKKVIEHTVHLCNLSALAEISLPLAEDVRIQGGANSGNVAYDDEKNRIELPDDCWAALFAAKQSRYIYCDGGITDAKFAAVLKSTKDFDGKTLIARNSGCLMLSEDSTNTFYARGGKIAVLYKTNLIAVTVNPFSAYGHSFNESEFLEKMSEAVPLPVFNVADKY